MEERTNSNGEDRRDWQKVKMSDERWMEGIVCYS